MKRLSINRIAAAGIRQNRRAYAGLIAGIFLSIFFVTSLCLFTQGVLLAREARVKARVGSQDAFYLDGELTDAQLLETGYFAEDIGHVYVTAGVEGAAVWMGYCDEAAVRILNRSCIEGRLPEMPGEIAVEQSALALMRRDNIAVGEEVTLPLVPVDGEAQRRTFTVVGILREQTSYLDVSSSVFASGMTLHWPSILTCPEEPGFAVGRTVQHRLLNFAPGTFLYATLLASERREFGDGVYAVMMGDGSWTTWMSRHAWVSGDSQTEQLLIFIALMGGALLLATCVAIAGAMESQLARKREEIGMLRAVGATRRQIRRIFGREAWLLALIVSPVSVALGALFVAGAARLLPEYLVFEANPLVLLPVLGLTALVILLASGLPLRRASRIMPMSVMRDTALLSRTKRLRSRERFKVPQLISWRQNRLHPTRQLGAIVLVGVMSVMIAFAVAMAGYNWEADFESDPEYRLTNYEYWSATFAALEPRETLTQGDIGQLASLPLVQKVTSLRRSKVNLLLDEVPGYFTPTHWGEVYGRTQFMSAELAARMDMESYYEYQLEQYDAVRALLGVTRDVVGLNVLVMDIDPDNLPAQALTGHVDLDAIDAGREVLVYAPDFYYEYESRDYASGNSNGQYWTRTADDGKHRWDEVTRNDYFVPGMQLDLVQLWAYEDLRDPILSGDYSGCERADASVSVGGVLSGANDAKRGLWNSVTVITTERGARALGWHMSRISDVKIYLSDTPDSEGEEALTRRIETIAMRAGLETDNNMALSRQYHEYQLQATMVLSAVSVVLFAVAVGMIAGGVTRRIRADERMIGTLRAVGADSRAIARCYSGSTWLAVSAGAVLGVLLVLGLQLAGVLPVEYIAAYAIPLVYVCIVAFAALTLLCCQALTRLRVGDVMRRSIVENIREL